jgi:hypothetical protein
MIKTPIPKYKIGDTLELINNPNQIKVFAIRYNLIIIENKLNQFINSYTIRYLVKMDGVSKMFYVTESSIHHKVKQTTKITKNN